MNKGKKQVSQLSFPGEFYERQGESCENLIVL